MKINEAEVDPTIRFWLDLFKFLLIWNFLNHVESIALVYFGGDFFPFGVIAHLCSLICVKNNSTGINYSRSFLFG